MIKQYKRLAFTVLIMAIIGTAILNKVEATELPESQNKKE